MGGGNGAKAIHKREVAQKKGANAGPTSQLKTNAAAQTIKCNVCFQTFQGTAKQPMLQQHIDGKHGDKKDKTFKDFFPSFVAA